MESLSLELFGKDPKMQKALQFAENVAVTRAPILLVGEVGTGKRSMGRYIHQSSNRANRELKIVDCSQESQDVENKILGHREESTGRFIKGALEEANQGTVIFANIDALDESFQKRLHKIFNELADYEIDVRIISTTTKNLSKLVGAGRFYRGLYTFLSGTQVNLPPLRERASDIEVIAKYLIGQYCVESNSGPVQLGTEALEKLNSHYWTHNVGELKAVIENSLTDNSDEILDVNDVSIGEKKTVSMIADADEDGITLMSLKNAERLLIKKALVHTSENRTQAAKILGVSIRTLRNKINEYRGDGNQFFLNLR